MKIKRNKGRTPPIRVNESIRAEKVRVLASDGENLGILNFKEALSKARALGLDLLEITPSAEPPVVKMTDYGKYFYDQKKIQKERRENADTNANNRNETKTTQIKIGTGKDILDMRANNIRKWLDQGYVVHIDLFLSGRYRSMDEGFLKERLERFLQVIPGTFSRIGEIKKGGKGYMVVIQPSK